MNQDLPADSISSIPNPSLKEFLLTQHYVAISLSQYPTGHFYTEVVLNDRPGRFLVDTGSGYTLFDERQKDRFAVHAIPSTAIGTGAGGTGLAIELSDRNQLSIGSFTIDDCSLRVLTLESINARFREYSYPEIDGAIGADLLTEGKAVIDYVTLTLYLKNEHNSE